MTGDKKFRFLLVHGTFAKGAKWTRPGSHLHNALLANFPGTTVEYFDWTGRNSHAARNDAAAELQNLIEEMLDKNRNGQLWIIAHSHGGNVALRAVAEFDGHIGLGGLVCIATPFITARPRDVSSVKSVMQIVAPFMTGMFAVLLFSIAVVLSFVFLLERMPFLSGQIEAFLTENAWLVLLGIPLLYAIIPKVFERVMQWATRKIKSLFVRVSDRQKANVMLDAFAIERTPVIAAFVVADEAAMGMGLGQIVGNLPATIWPIVALMIKILLWLFGLTLLGGAVATVVTGHTVFELVYMDVTMTLVTLAPLAVGLVLLMVIVPYLVRGLFVFGGEGLLDNFASVISVSKFLPEKIRNRQHLPFVIGYSPLMLRHSHLYQNAGFLQSLCDTIRRGKIEGQTVRRAETGNAPGRWRMAILQLILLAGVSAYALRDRFPLYAEELAISASPSDWRNRYPQLTGKVTLERRWINVSGTQPDDFVRTLPIEAKNCSLIGEVFSSDEALVTLHSDKIAEAQGTALGWPSHGGRNRQVIDARLPPGRYEFKVSGEKSILEKSVEIYTQELDANLTVVCWTEPPARFWNWRDWLKL